MKWVSRGPNNVGGRTKGLMFDPNDENDETVFAGGVSGGLFKTQIFQMEIPQSGYTFKEFPKTFRCLLLFMIQMI